MTDEIGIQYLRGLWQRMQRQESPMKEELKPRQSCRPFGI